MGKKDMDWGNIGFGYHVTDERYVANFKDGEWSDRSGLPLPSPMHESEKSK